MYVEQQACKKLLLRARASAHGPRKFIVKTACNFVFLRQVCGLGAASYSCLGPRAGMPAQQQQQQQYARTPLQLTVPVRSTDRWQQTDHGHVGPRANSFLLARAPASNRRGGRRRPLGWRAWPTLDAWERRGCRRRALPARARPCGGGSNGYRGGGTDGGGWSACCGSKGEYLVTKCLLWTNRRIFGYKVPVVDQQANIRLQSACCGSTGDSKARGIL